MASWLEAIGNEVLGKFGYRLEPLQKPLLRRPIPAGEKLYVGCGEHDLEGYIGCDLRQLRHVQLVCRAWEVSEFCGDLAEIYSRHMMEHLTFDQARLTLQDWHRALGPGGTVRIEVPNIEFAINQWQHAQWSEESLSYKFSDARWGFAGFFGWQRECNPEDSDYNQTYWDVHKSGYSGDSMRFFLQQAGFEGVELRYEGFTDEQNRRRNLAPDASHGCHLIATARKSVLSQKLAA